LLGFCVGCGVCVGGGGGGVGGGGGGGGAHFVTSSPPPPAEFSLCNSAKYIYIYIFPLVNGSTLIHGHLLSSSTGPLCGGPNKRGHNQMCGFGRVLVCGGHKVLWRDIV